jgi:hypothetical protein
VPSNQTHANAPFSDRRNDEGQESVATDVAEDDVAGMHTGEPVTTTGLGASDWALASG